MGGVGDGDDRSAGGDELAGFDMVGEDDATEGREEAGVIQAGLGKREGGGGLFSAGAGLENRLGARARLDEFGAFGRFSCASVGDLELGLRGFELARRDGVLFEQFLLTSEVEPRAFALGLGAADDGVGGGDLLRPRAGLEFGEEGLRGCEFGAAEGDFLHLLRIVEPCHELTGGDALALGNEAFRDAARVFEAELRIGDLKVAGECEFAGAVALTRTGGHEQGRGAEEQKRSEMEGSASRREYSSHSLCVRRG